MNILFFGDIFGKPGRMALEAVAAELVEQYKADFVIANVENLAHGRGVTRATLAELEELGLFHCYTTGNHVWAKDDVAALLQGGGTPVLRPINYPEQMPGEGVRVVANGAQRLLVVNAMGRVFMKEEGERLSNPFGALDAVLERYTLDPSEDEKEHVDAIFVDFHAEATSEKRSLGFYSDGRVSAVVGTHTHVPTADAQVLPGGTAYISDVGMVGALHSSLGLEREPMVQQFVTEEPHKKEVSGESQIEVGAVHIRVGVQGRAEAIEHIRRIVSIG
jgi:metallophosphoesterase (TIGR00282 family)